MIPQARSHSRLQGLTVSLLVLLLRILLLVVPSNAFLAVIPLRHNSQLTNDITTTHLNLSSQAAAASTEHQRRHNNNNNPNIPLDRQIAQAGRRGQTDQALALFASIPSPTLRQLNAAIDACGRARPTPRVDTAFRLLHDHPQSPNVYTYGALLNGIRRAGNVPLALQVLDYDMPRHHVAPNAVIYQSVIATAAAAANVDTARRVLRRMAPPTLIAYNAALAAAAKAGRVDVAIELWQELQQTKSMVPDAVTYGTVLAACEAGREWERLLELAKEFFAEDVLDDQALTTVIHACQQLGQADWALELLERMQGPVDVVTYRLVISACARGGAWREGIALLDRVPVHDTVAYTAAITGCEYAGEWKEACRLLARMRTNGCPTNRVTMAAVIGACATACAKQTEDGLFFDDTPKQKALQLLMAVRKDDSVMEPSINVYNAAMRACAESRDIKTAFSLLELAEKDGIKSNIVTFGTLMTACERVAAVKIVPKVFHLMKDRNIRPNEIVYGAAISCCRKAGEPDSAYRLWELMQKDETPLRPNTATMNTVMLAQVENISNATSTEVKSIIARARKVFDAIAHPNRQSFEILIRGHCAARQPSEANRILESMAKNLTPDVDLYTLTIAAYERNGKPREALRLLESMRAKGYDFYQSKVLDSAFKRLVKLANAALGGV